MELPIGRDKPLQNLPLLLAYGSPGISPSHVSHIWGIKRQGIWPIVSADIVYLVTRPLMCLLPITPNSDDAQPRPIGDPHGLLLDKPLIIKRCAVEPGA
jgi:hypothetical protein